MADMKISGIVAAFLVPAIIAVFTVSHVLADEGPDKASPASIENEVVVEKKRPSLLVSNVHIDIPAIVKPAVAEKSLDLLIPSPIPNPEAVNEQAVNEKQQKEGVLPEIDKSEAIKETRTDSVISGVDPKNETAMKAIGKSITLFSDRLRERFSIWLERSAKYAEIMKDVLKDKEMPEELVFLPIVESGFNMNAYSSARAVGPWQFISSTAKRYGLVIDWWRDERKDPVKSTRAAADYLKDLYQMFGSWKLALAAYNAGEGRISKALKRSGTDNYWSLLGTKQIRQETKDYVPRYIAAAMIANTPEDYGFHNLAYHQPLSYEEVTLEGPVDIDIIARCAGVSVNEIRELNPELRRWSTPTNVSSYTIKIPEGTSDAFILSLAAIPDKERFSVDKYKVRKGDSLKKIAKNAGLPVNAIIALNSTDGSAVPLKVGEVISVPPKDKYSADRDDKVSAKKASYKKKTTTGRKGRRHSNSIAKVKGKKSKAKRI